MAGGTLDGRLFVHHVGSDGRGQLGEQVAAGWPGRGTLRLATLSLRSLRVRSLGARAEQLAQQDVNLVDAAAGSARSGERGAAGGDRVELVEGEGGAERAGTTDEHKQETVSAA